MVDITVRFKTHWVAKGFVNKHPIPSFSRQGSYPLQMLLHTRESSELSLIAPPFANNCLSYHPLSNILNAKVFQGFAPSTLSPTLSLSLLFLSNSLTIGRRGDVKLTKVAHRVKLLPAAAQVPEGGIVVMTRRARWSVRYETGNGLRGV